MTYDQILEIAQRRGWLRWPHSGIVERLRVPKRSNSKRYPGPIVTANPLGPKPRKEHVIWPPRAPEVTYGCAETEPPAKP
jgi:hypothetical protein